MKKTVIGYAFIAIFILAAIIFGFAFIGAEFDFAPSMTLRTMITQNLSTISLTAVLGALSAFFGFIRTIKADNNTLIANMEKKDAEQTVTINRLNKTIEKIEQSEKENEVMRAEVKNTNQSMNAMYSLCEYLMLKNTNDPFAKDTFLKIRQAETEKKVDEYVEQKKVKTEEKRSLIISKRQ